MNVNLAPENMRFVGHARGRHVVDRIISHEPAVATLQSTIKTLQSKGLSVHYTIDRDGAVMQHCGVERYTLHAGIPGMTTGHNTRSIGLEFINRYYGHRVDQTKGLALYSGEYAPDIISGIWVDRAWNATKKAFMNPARLYIMPTPVQCEAGWQLMSKLLEMFPNVAKAGWSGVTRTLSGKRVYNWQPVAGHDSPGVKCHALHAHADGRTVDYYMLLRANGLSSQDAYTKMREDASSMKRQTPLPF